MSSSTMPTINHASQLGISKANHFTAPTARKAIPRIAITTPARAKLAQRNARLTKRSALFAIPPKV